MIIVTRPFDGISLNTELEYLLDEHDDILEFESVGDAKSYLFGQGLDEDDISYLTFREARTGEEVSAIEVDN